MRRAATPRLQPGNKCLAAGQPPAKGTAGTVGRGRQQGCTMGGGDPAGAWPLEGAAVVEGSERRWAGAKPQGLVTGRQRAGSKGDLLWPLPMPWTPAQKDQVNSPVTSYPPFSLQSWPLDLKASGDR